VKQITTAVGIPGKPPALGIQYMLILAMTVLVLAKEREAKIGVFTRQFSFPHKYKYMLPPNTAGLPSPQGVMI
jgi:hypothetical protein